MFVCFLSGTSSAIAQERRIDEQVDPQPQQQKLVIETPAGQTAQSAVGQAGRRLTRDQAAVEGIEPLARIANRIQNRVQNRVRNRIDQTYDPQPSSPFAVAEEHARTAVHPPRQ
jgi:hypothetical protein